MILSVGYIFRSKFPISVLIFFSGAIFLFLFVTTDNIQALGLDTTETPLYNLTYPMEQTARTGGTAFSTTLFGITERPANTNSLIYNQPVSCIRVNLVKSGTPVGSAEIGVWDGDNMLVKSFGTITASSVNTVSREYKFCLSNHDYYIISLHDRIGVKYTAGTVGNTLSVGVSTANPFDGTNTVVSTYTSGAWADTNANDMTMILTYETILINNEQDVYAIRNPVTFEPTFVGISFILLSLGFILVGALIEAGKFN